MKRINTMKSFAVVLLFSALFLTGSGRDVRAALLDITAAVFPDENFRKCVLDLDNDKDGKLDDEEIVNIRVLDLTNKGIKSFQGIGKLYNLQEFTCSGNYITKLDVSELPHLYYLDCSFNYSLQDLIVKGAANMQVLECSYCHLSKLDVTGLARLTRLYCSHNYMVGKIRVIGIDESRTFLDFGSQTVNSNPPGRSDIQKIRVRNDGLWVSWTASEDAEGYYLLRRTSKTGVWKIFATITSSTRTSYVDRTVKPGYVAYGIQAFSEGGVNPAYNSSEPGTEYCYLPAVNGISLENSQQGVTVTWNRQEEAEFYVVYRRQGTSAWKRLGSVKNKGTEEKASFLDKAVNNRNNEMFSYTVRPAAKAGGKEVLGYYIPDGKEILRLRKIQISGCVNSGQGEVTAGWPRNGAASGYEVQISSSHAFLWNRSYRIMGHKNASIVMKNLKKGSRYYVRVRSFRNVNSETYYSAWSTLANVKIEI